MGRDLTPSPAPPLARAEPSAPVLQALPPGVLTLADHEARAQSLMPAPAWAYVSGGAADEHTLRANATDWADMRLLPPVLCGNPMSRLDTPLLGHTLAHPLMVAPMAFQRLVHPDGELGMAHAAAAQAAGLVLGTQASVALEGVAQAFCSYPERGPLWFQLYPLADRGHTLELLRRVERAGYEAVVLTVDAMLHGVRDRERRAGFTLPAGVDAVNITGQSLATTLGWDDFTWLREQTRLPLLLKGVLRADDARRAAALGADGLIVSNHGGRTLDTTVSTAWALPRIANALRDSGHTLLLLVDGGIRRGTDVLKALALGATAVLVGRPCLWGLASAGALGAAHVLRLLKDELSMAMALSGCASTSEITPALLAPTH